MSIGITSTTPVARKEHKCQWCLLKIEIGKIYRRSFNVFDGQAYTWKNHIHCEEIAGKLKMFDHEYSEGLNSEMFRENIREEYIRLQEHYNSDIFNYEGFIYPDFEGQLKYVISMHKPF